MIPLPKTLLSTAIGAAVLLGAIGAPRAARADAFAQSILVIENFRLLHANGTSYTASDFSLLAGASDAQASAQLNGVFASGAQSFDLSSGLSADLAHQSVGSGGPARPENNFNPFPGPSVWPGAFGYADQHMAGGMITTSLGAAGAQMQTRADASLTGPGSASGNSGIGSSSTFSFSLGVGEYMTIAFNATPFSQADVSGGAAAGASANASLAWRISILDLTTGATVFTYQPEQLNSLSTVSRTGGFDGVTTYAPGQLFFSATTEMLNVGDIYQITIAQGSLAAALQSNAVPEPATLAGFGAGLLAMAWLTRRRRTPERLLPDPLDMNQQHRM